MYMSTRFSPVRLRQQTDTEDHYTQTDRTRRGRVKREPQGTFGEATNCGESRTIGKGGDECFAAIQPRKSSYTN